MLALVESDAYRLGALIGRLLGILIPVVLGVVLAVRWHRRGRRLGWLWGALIAVGGVLVLLVASYLASGGRVTDELEPGQVLAEPAGIRFRPAPGLQSQTEDQLRADPDVGDALQSVVVRDVVSNDGTLIGLVSVVAMEPFVAGQPGQEEGFVRGLQARSGAEAASVTIEGQRLSQIVAPPSETTRRVYVLGWQYENLFISVSAADGATARSVATSLIRQQATLP